MEAQPGNEFKMVDALQSGKFYLAKTVNKCYRINEVDHYLKDQETQFICFLDRQEKLHHFNRLSAKQVAITPLSDLLSVPNLKELSFYELTPLGLDTIMQKKGEKSNSKNATYDMVRKLVQAYATAQTEETGVTIAINDLKSKYVKAYIQPKDLKD